MKTKEIRDLIDFIAETGLNEVNIETEELKLSVKREPKIKQIIDSGTRPSAPAAPVETAPVAAAPAAAPAAPVAKAEDTTAASGQIEIKSPMIGTFYRASNPESDPFISVGDSVSVGQTVCIVEAMKLFNEIESEVSGKIVKILVDNGTPVEYDQPLFLVDPS
ncbi:MAG: acetyl-CoA carboxylase biotin carboxyl carrier protein [Eudoraea sp.]|nr:acetyl-CoA carboxylase biotin carboxyl carrier protein [Eudoraea sp.]